MIWVNCHNMFDAAAGFGGYKESGFGREGGKEGLYLYVRPSWQARAVTDVTHVTDFTDVKGATGVAKSVEIP